MMHKSDVFVFVGNEGPNMDRRETHLSMIKHKDGNKHTWIKDKRLLMHIPGLQATMIASKDTSEIYMMTLYNFVHKHL